MSILCNSYIHSAPGAPTAFSDDFNRPNENLEVSPNWTRVGGLAGDASIEGNVVRSNTIATSPGVYFCPDQGPGDRYVQCTIAASRNAFGGVLRATDSDNWIGMRYNSTRYEVYKRDTGTFTLINFYTVALNTSTIIRLEVVGNDFEFFVDGVSRFTFTDTFNSAETGMGILARSQVGVFVDNWEAGLL